MNIIAHTTKAQELISRIKTKIDKQEIKTWEIKKSDSDIVYNHNPEQWSDKALIRPENHNKGLLFEIVWWDKNGEPEVEIKGYIIGRFTEMLMVHFRDQFEYLEIH